jgi:hypothetical protein
MVHDFSYTVVVSYIFQDWFVNVARQVDFLSVSKHIASSLSSQIRPWLTSKQALKQSHLSLLTLRVGTPHWDNLSSD